MLASLLIARTGWIHLLLFARWFGRPTPMDVSPVVVIGPIIAIFLVIVAVIVIITVILINVSSNRSKRKQDG